MVFQQYSLYPHLTVRENLAFPLRSPALRTPPAEIARKVGAVAEVLRIAAQARQQGDRPVRRRDAARLHRPGAGSQPLGLPDGRAALLARRQAARRAPHRAQAHPGGRPRHLRLRHPRPDRGDDDGDPRRRPRPRPPRPVRHPARDLREPGLRLRRQPPRPAAYQPSPRRPLRRRPRRRAHHRPPPGADRPGRGRGEPRSPASSASATRPACTFRSATTRSSP